MPFSDTITVTVDSTARVHSKAWDSAFQKDIAQGSTSIRKTVDGSVESIVRVAHSEKNDRKRHLFQVIENEVDSSGIKRVRKVHVVIEYDDTPVEKTQATLLAVGALAAVDATCIGNLVADSL